MRCTQCGTLALAKVPADLGRFYPSDYYRVPRGRAELIAIGGTAERAKLALVRRFAPRGRMLEIGPATGAFLAVAQEDGYAVQAVEMDPECCTFLEGELGVDTVQSDDPIGALAELGTDFDVIALWQVIEHLPDPRSVIAAAAGALAPGGVLVLAAPNPGALGFRVLGSRWTHLDAPRHLFLLPLATLTRLGADNGLEPVLSTTDDVSARGWNTFGWRESLAGFAHRAAAVRVLRMLGALITLVLAPIERRGHNGSTYTLILRRPSD